MEDSAALEMEEDLVLLDVDVVVSAGFCMTVDVSFPVDDFVLDFVLLLLLPPL